MLNDAWAAKVKKVLSIKVEVSSMHGSELTLKRSFLLWLDGVSLWTAVISNRNFIMERTTGFQWTDVICGVGHVSDLCKSQFPHPPTGEALALLLQHVELHRWAVSTHPASFRSCPHFLTLLPVISGPMSPEEGDTFSDCTQTPRLGFPLKGALRTKEDTVFIAASPRPTHSNHCSATKSLNSSISNYHVFSDDIQRAG